MQFSGPHAQSYWFSRSYVGPKNFHSITFPVILLLLGQGSHLENYWPTLTANISLSSNLKHVINYLFIIPSPPLSQSGSIR